MSIIDKPLNHTSTDTVEADAGRADEKDVLKPEEFSAEAAISDIGNLAVESYDGPPNPPIEGPDPDVADKVRRIADNFQFDAIVEAFKNEEDHQEELRAQTKESVFEQLATSYESYLSLVDDIDNIRETKTKVIEQQELELQLKEWLSSAKLDYMIEQMQVDPELKFTLTIKPNIEIDAEEAEQLAYKLGEKHGKYVEIGSRTLLKRYTPKEISGIDPENSNTNPVELGLFPNKVDPSMSYTHEVSNIEEDLSWGEEDEYDDTGFNYQYRERPTLEQMKDYENNPIHQRDKRGDVNRQIERLKLKQGAYPFVQSSSLLLDLVLFDTTKGAEFHSRNITLPHKAADRRVGHNSFLSVTESRVMGNSFIFANPSRIDSLDNGSFIIGTEPIRKSDQKGRTLIGRLAVIADTDDPIHFAA